MIKKSKNAIVKQQSHALQVLSSKKMVHPELIQNHFEAFIRMTNKAIVEPIVLNFLQTCAYLGFVDGINVLKLTQTMRRIFKHPRDLGSVSSVLDYLVLLALSGKPYGDFDVKSKDFVEQCLTYVQDSFQGVHTVEQQVEKRGRPQKVQLHCFASIEAENKTFNKTIVRRDHVTKLLEKRALKEAAAREEQVDGPVESSGEGTGESGDETETQPGEGMTTDAGESQEEAEGATPASAASPADKKKEVKSYDQRSSESKGNEEIALQFSKLKKIDELTQRQQHVLMFSSLDSLQFQDLNKSDLARAWVVLFHFRGIQQDTYLFTEFDSLAFRNSKAKFQDSAIQSAYSMMLKHGQAGRLKYEVNRRCKRSGWPLDIQIVSRRGAPEDERKQQ